MKVWGKCLLTVKFRQETTVNLSQPKNRGSWSREREQGQRDMDGGWITESLVESAVKGCVLISHGRHHKSPQSGWLQATARFSHRVLEAWKPRPGFHQDWFPLWALGESLFSSSLLASGGSYNPWPSLACRHITPISAPVSPSPPALCLKVSNFPLPFSLYLSLDLGFTLNPRWSHLEILILITSTKIFFPSKVIFTGCGSQNTYCLLNGDERHYSTRCRDPVEDSNGNSTWAGMF